jgi:hypothetical protein
MTGKKLHLVEFGEYRLRIGSGLTPAVSCTVDGTLK